MAGRIPQINPRATHIPMFGSAVTKLGANASICPPYLHVRDGSSHVLVNFRSNVSLLPDKQTIKQTYEAILLNEIKVAVRSMAIGFRLRPKVQFGSLACLVRHSTE